MFSGVAELRSVDRCRSVYIKHEYTLSQQQIQIVSVRLGYYYYFLYFFLHPSPDSTTNSDRLIHRLNGQREIGVLLLFLHFLTPITRFNNKFRWAYRAYIVLMASVRLGYCYYFLRLLLFFYTFQHPSPDSTTNSDRLIYRLNGKPKIGILLLFFTLAISFSINEYYLLYDTRLISWRIIQSVARWH